MFRFGGIAPGAGIPVTQATVGFLAGFAVTWNWDAPTRRFVRTIFGSPDIGSNRERLGATNVLIQQVRYHGGDRNGVGAEATLSGTGHGWVLTRGRVLAEGDYATVSKNPDVIAAYLGSEHV